MHPTLAKYDDLTIVSRDLTQVDGFTLSGLVHNEMHFLPAFLTHYRALGVARFIFIDDRSTDGSLAFLKDQPDVMVLHSRHRYGDQIAEEDARALGLPHQRMALVWRMLLLEKYALDQWSLHLDADEFMDLPPGLSIADFARQLGEGDVRAVWSIMLDMYPARLSDLADMREDASIDLDRDWYFDGKRHLWLRGSANPSRVYTGARARMLLKFGLNRRSSPMMQRLIRALRLPVPRYNAIRKPIMLRWAAGHRFDSAHTVSLPMSPTYLLPLRHYKFNGSIYDRIVRATTTGGNTNGGIEYQDMARLLTVMSEGDDDFRSSKSVRFTGFADFQRTGNADGFD